MGSGPFLQKLLNYWTVNLVRPAETHLKQSKGSPRSFFSFFNVTYKTGRDKKTAPLATKQMNMEIFYTVPDRFGKFAIDSESKHSVVELEVIAILWAVEYFQKCVYEVRLEIFLDEKPQKQCCRERSEKLIIFRPYFIWKRKTFKSDVFFFYNICQEFIYIKAKGFHP